MFAAKIQLLFELNNNTDNSIGLGSANEDIFRATPPSPHLHEASLVAHHKEGRRVVAAHEVVEVQWLPYDEAGAKERVAGLESHTSEDSAGPNWSYHIFIPYSTTTFIVREEPSEAIAFNR